MMVDAEIAKKMKSTVREGFSCKMTAEDVILLLLHSLLHNLEDAYLPKLRIAIAVLAPSPSFNRNQAKWVLRVRASKLVGPT